MSVASLPNVLKFHHQQAFVDPCSAGCQRAGANALVNGNPRVYLLGWWLTLGEEWSAKAYVDGSNPKAWGWWYLHVLEHPLWAFYRAVPISGSRALKSYLRCLSCRVEAQGELVSKWLYIVETWPDHYLPSCELEGCFRGRDQCTGKVQVPAHWQQQLKSSKVRTFFRGNEFDGNVRQGDWAHHSWRGCGM